MNQGQILHRAILTVFLAAAAAPLSAETVRVLPAGQQPRDARLGPLKDLNGYFPFRVPPSKAAWDTRRAQLQRRILVATGLWPMLPKTDLNAVIHGKVERDGFTVEKAYFESMPGHFVTGLLFRPQGAEGRRPAVLSPHGHGGRLQDLGAEGVRRQIVDGQERFEGSGRFPKLARCAQLARMGCVTFIYDMLGYADSVQISRDVAHKLREPRLHLENSERWGLFTAQAELRLQNSMGLQTFNSIRALDFLCSLPDVDPTRIAVTGGSGGGTQTLILCAIDSRPAVAFPQGMVSTAMQGGCLCENCSLLRVGTGNVELTALFAPKPLAMTAAGDWTREMMTKGYPELVELYELLGTKENVFCKSLVHFPHNYNYVTRALMYGWMNKHLNLGLEEPIVEEDFPPLTPEEYTVWNDQHPAPEGGEEYEVALTAAWDRTSRELIAQAYPRDAQHLKSFRELVGAAWSVLIGREQPSADDVSRVTTAKLERNGVLEVRDLVRNDARQEELPVVWLYPQQVAWNGELVIWIDGNGKQALFQNGGQLDASVRQLLDQGYSVAGIDLFQQGEFLTNGQRLDQTRINDGGRPSAVYTFGYNDTLFARRVHDVLTLVAWVKKEKQDVPIHLVGSGDAGPIAAAASAQLGDIIDRRVIDGGGFRFADIDSYRHIQFVPGAVKYGDLPALLALSAPEQLWIADAGARPPSILSDAYAAADASDNLRAGDGSLKQIVADALLSEGGAANGPRP